MTTSTPFLKWVGGKTQILEHIHHHVPSKMGTYYELFLGGGSVLISLLEERRINDTFIADKYIVYDLNEHLIQCYIDIQQNHVQLLQNLNTLATLYYACPVYKAKPREKIQVHGTLEEASISKTHLYYYIRSEYNKLKKKEGVITKSQTTLKSTYFIFLNKTGWRGMYRESVNGYNIPFGNNKKSTVYNEDNINQLHILFNDYDVEFTVSNFNTFDTNQLCSDDFVYIDSPYYPINDKSFTAYTINDFGKKDHNALFDKCELMRCKFLLSNVCVPWTEEKYKKWNVSKVLCRRAIGNRKVTEEDKDKPESKAMEILVTNME